jgi:hypothetical protein
VTVEYLRIAYDGLSKRILDTQVMRDYYEGRHRRLMASNNFINPFRSIIDGAVENMCRPTVDLCVDRLDIASFESVEPGDPIADAAADFAWDLWQDSHMDLNLQDWLREMEITGHPGTLIVWPDGTGDVDIAPQKPENVWAQMSEENPGVVVWAVKFWRGDDGFSRATLYTADQITVYVSSDRSLMRPDPSTYSIQAPTYELDDDGVPATVITDNPMPNPFQRCPVFVADLGCSDLRDVIPLQNMLNKALANSLVAGEGFSLPLRVWLGLDVEIDPETGRKVPPFTVGTNRDVFLPANMDGMQPVDVKDLQGHSPEPFLLEADSHRAAIARIARVPQHLLLQNSVPVSGLALTIAEQPFVAKLHGRQRRYGATIIDAVEFAFEVAMYIKTGRPVEGPGVGIVWKAAETQSPLDNIKNVTELTSVGVPLKTALVKLLGWSEEEAEAAQDAADAAKMAAVTNAANAISSGVDLYDVIEPGD